MALSILDRGLPPYKMYKVFPLPDGSWRPLDMIETNTLDMLRTNTLDMVSTHKPWTC